MRHGVHYWVLNKGVEPVEHKSAACFSGIWGKRQDAIRFMIYYNHNVVSKEMLDLYLGFVRRLLRMKGCAKWTARKFKDHKILIRLETKGLKDKQCLFYLTWFRYIQEMPMFLVNLYARKADGDDDEALFRKFQEIHYECLAGKIAGCYTNTNHGLILKDSYGSNSKGEPITIERLASNISKNPSSVFSYFK